MLHASDIQHRGAFHKPVLYQLHVSCRRGIFLQCNGDRFFEQQKLRCKRCNHEWIQRDIKLPKVCPRCKSPYWNLPKKEKAFIEENYKTAYQQYDLYVLFYELAFKLVKEGGYIGLITPNKFAITKYGFPLRKLLLDYTILKVVDVSQLSVFGDVSTYPYIVILQKVKSKTNSKGPKLIVVSLE